MLNLVKDLFSAGKKTAAAGTPIIITVPYRKRLKAWLDTIKYTCGSTAHLLTLMKPFGFARLASRAAAGQNVVTLLTDPGVGTPTGGIAAGDYVCLEGDDNSTTQYTVASVSGSVPALAVTLSANLAVSSSAVDSRLLQNTGAQARRLWYFGQPGTLGHLNFDTTASALNSITPADSDTGIGGADHREEPLLLYSPNTTAAGIFEQVNGAYLSVGAN